MVIRREGKRKSMGEYYDWVNVDRKEYICPSDFGMGNKLLESSNRHNSLVVVKLLVEKTYIRRECI